MALGSVTDIEGRLTLWKVDLEQVTASQAVSVLESLIIDDLVFADVSRHKAREYLRGQVEEQMNIMLLLEAQRKIRQGRAQETWGMGAMGVMGNENAQAIVGGPAGPPPAPRE